MRESDRYLKIVEWSEEDQCYVGSVPGWIGAACHGDNEEKVYHELCQIVDEWIEIYKKEGKPLPEGTAGKSYSGRFVLRVDPELHKRLAIHAAQAGTSLNKYCATQLESA